MCSKLCQSIKLWRQSDAVCFDFDSTLVKDEFIDQMADFVGKGPEVSAVTQLAMTGALPFEDALDARLKTINITQFKLDQLLDKLFGRKPYRISDGAEELIETLQARNVDVYIISGSFVQAITPVAAHLSIPQERVFSNGLIFDGDGNYLGFDRDRPTARKGGKRTIVEMLKKTHKYKCLAFIGDGATDLETYDPPHATDLFVGFGGNVSREVIRNKAPLFVDSFTQLTEWLTIRNGCVGGCCSTTDRVSCGQSVPKTCPAMTTDGAFLS